MNNESQLENSDFSDGYLLMDDNPKQNKTDRAADLYYDSTDIPLVLEDLGDAAPTGHYKKDPVPVNTPADAPSLASIDGRSMTVMESFNEAEERTAEDAAINAKYHRGQTKLYNDRKYFDDITLKEHGEKIARVIGIDLIVIFLAAAVNSFFTGDGMDLVISLIRIGFTVAFMKGYRVARWFMMFTVAISIYGPFVLLFVSEQPKTPMQIIIYSIVLLMYACIEVLLFINRDIKEYCTKQFVS